MIGAVAVVALLAACFAQQRINRRHRWLLENLHARDTANAHRIARIERIQQAESILHAVEAHDAATDYPRN